MSRRLMEATASVAAAGVFVTGCQPAPGRPSPVPKETTPKTFCRPIVNDWQPLTLDIQASLFDVHKAATALGISDESMARGDKVPASCTRSFTKQERDGYAKAPYAVHAPSGIGHYCVAWDIAPFKDYKHHVPTKK